MPEYCFSCEKCGRSASIIRPMRQAGDPFICECGNEMHRDYGNEGVVTNIPKTLGYFMNRNADRLSEDEKNHIKTRNQRDDS